MYTKIDLERLTVLQLRQVAKEVRVKLGAGIDKAGIVEKILKGQEALSQAITPAPESFEEKPDSLLSFDVTSAPKASFQTRQQEEVTRTPSPGAGWQNRSNFKTGFRGKNPPVMKRFGPRAQTEETEAADSNRDGFPVPETKPKENLVTSDGYRLGYQAQNQRGAYAQRDGGDQGSYRPRYPYQQRSVIPDPTSNHFHDDVYQMARNVEFDNQLQQGKIPELLSCQEGNVASGTLDILPDGFGFLRDGKLISPEDVYVSQAQIKRFGLRGDDTIEGKSLLVKADDPYPSLLYIEKLNGKDIQADDSRRAFESLDAVYPNKRIPLEAVNGKDPFMRLMDLVTPMGYGQRGFIIAPSGSDSLRVMKNIAQAILKNDQTAEIFMLLIDVAPEDITEMKRAVNAEIFSASFAEAPENQTRLSETMLERAQRVAMDGKNAVILLDSLNKLVRAYQNQVYQGTKPINNTVTPSALIRPKRLLGMAKNTEQAGSLTVIATLQVETGSRIDDIIYDEFKGIANMTLTLCSPSEDDPITPMIDLKKCVTKREELLQTEQEKEGLHSLYGLLAEENNASAVAQITDMIKKTRNNQDMLSKLKGWIAFQTQNK